MIGANVYRLQIFLAQDNTSIDTLFAAEIQQINMFRVMSSLPFTFVSNM